MLKPALRGLFAAWPRALIFLPYHPSGLEKTAIPAGQFFLDNSLALAYT